jgi:hypothetical protein
MVWTENWALTWAHDLKALRRMTQTAESEGIDAVMLREHIVRHDRSPSDAGRRLAMPRRLTGQRRREWSSTGTSLATLSVA